jgi:citrate synthase
MRSSVVAATTAGILAADSRSYGQKTLPEGMVFIQRAMAERKSGLSAREIVKIECAHHGGKPQFMGYARPIAKGDERLGAMEKVSKNLGFTQGDHLALAYDFEQVLIDEFDEAMNINGYISAFLSDQKFTPQEVYQICAVLVTSGVTACYVDTFERPAETFLPLRCDDMDYQGPPPRLVPLAEELEKS